MQKRVPEGHQIVEVKDLAQKNSAVQEHIVLNVQHVRHRQLPAPGRPGRQQHDHQTQNALGEHEQIIAAGLALRACREGLRRARQPNGGINGRCGQRHKQDDLENAG